MNTEIKQQNHSMRTLLSRMMVLQLVAVALILAAYSIVTIHNARQDSLQTMGNFAEIYAAQLQNRLNDINTNLVQILNEDQNLNRLSSTDPNEILYAQLDLQHFLQEMMAYSDGADCYAIYEDTSKTYLDYWSYNWTISGKKAVREYMESVYNTEVEDAGWHFVILEDKVFGVKLYRWRSRAIAALVDIQSLLSIVPESVDMEYGVVMSDPEDRIHRAAGEVLFTQEQMQAEGPLPMDDLDEIRIMLSSDQIKLSVCQRQIRLMDQLKGSSLLLVAAMVILLLIDIAFTGLIRKKLIGPMERMTEDMDRIRQGNHEIRIRDEEEISEFHLLSETFNRLMDEIFHLKLSYYEKQLDLMEAEQKYINLQIKPHFFLNALTSIAALSRMGQNRAVENYITALNKNIRYMFGSGMHTVTCREEMEHVENYFEMQDMKYPGMVFYYVDMPAETEEWRIPQMIVHTIVENEYKYAVAEGKLLSVYIRTCVTDKDGEPMLLLEIEDDGPGYPESVIDYMAGRGERDSSDGRRVGLWSLKRLLETMYDRQGLMEVENSELQGAVTRFFIPAAPVNERGRVR